MSSSNRQIPHMCNNLSARRSLCRTRRPRGGQRLWSRKNESKDRADRTIERLHAVGSETGLVPHRHYFADRRADRYNLRSTSSNSRIETVSRKIVALFGTFRQVLERYSLTSCRTGSNHRQNTNYEIAGSYVDRTDLQDASLGVPNRGQ
jgi:hypothetical protein